MSDAEAALESLLQRREFRAVLEVAAALEAPILAGAPSRDLLAILHRAFAADVFPDLPEADEARRAQVESLLAARLAGAPRPPDGPTMLGGYL